MAGLTNIQKRQEAAKKMKQDVSERLGRRERAAKVEDGTSKWRILPSWTGNIEDPIAHAFGQHFVKDANGDLKAVHLCLDKTYRKICPICDAVSSGIRNSTSDEMQKILSESKSSLRYLVNALQIDGKEPNKVVVLELAPTCFEQIDDLINKFLFPVKDEDGELDEPVDATDVEAGLNFEITRSGKGIGTKYKVLPARKVTKVPSSVLENLINLSDYVKQEHAETELKALAVLDVVVTGRLPAPTSAKKALANKLDADDDDEDILEGEFDDEPFEAVKASKKSSSIEEIDDLLGDLEDLDLD